MANEQFQLLTAPGVHVGFFPTEAAAKKAAREKGLVSFSVYRGFTCVYSQVTAAR